MATPFSPKLGKKQRPPVKPTASTIDSVTNVPPIGTAVRVSTGPHQIVGLVCDDGSYGVITLLIPTNGFYSHVFNASAQYGNWEFVILDDEEREDFLSFLEPKFRKSTEDYLQRGRDER